MSRKRVQVRTYPAEVAYSDMKVTHACSASPMYFVEFEDGYSGYFHTNEVHPHNVNQYGLEHKGQRYFIFVSPDVAARGGRNGKGTMTCIWRLDDSGMKLPPMKCYQGRHSKAGILRVIKNADWSSCE